VETGHLDGHAPKTSLQAFLPNREITGDRAVVEWVVHGARGTAIALTASADRAGTVRTEVTLGLMAPRVPHHAADGAAASAAARRARPRPAGAAGGERPRVDRRPGAPAGCGPHHRGARGSSATLISGYTCACATGASSAAFVGITVQLRPTWCGCCTSGSEAQVRASSTTGLCRQRLTRCRSARWTGQQTTTSVVLSRRIDRC
jgi:hypothetical protein